MNQYVQDVIRRAANPEHEWDHKAIEWSHLNSGSVVIEVGGYQGRWALQMADRYSPKLFVFEPQIWAYEVCCLVLKNKAMVYPYGLGVNNEFLTMSEYGTDGCSFVKDGTNNPSIGKLEPIDHVMHRIGIDKIDLMMMNIEGYEYTLIPHMLAIGLMPDILIVQWHTFVDPDGLKINAIVTEIEKTHHMLWDYGPMLMAWERRYP